MWVLGNETKNIIKYTFFTKIMIIVSNVYDTTFRESEIPQQRLQNPAAQQQYMYTLKFVP